MASQPPPPATHQDLETPPRTPRWVYLLGGLALAILLLVAALHLAGMSPGGHGP